MPTLYLYGVTPDPIRREISMASCGAMDLIRQFKADKKVTDLGAFGGSELTLVDWKKIPVIEVK